MRTAAKSRVVTTDAEIDEAIVHAKSAPQHIAIRATYQPEHDQIWAELTDGVVIGFPRRLLQGLENASPEDLTAIELEGGGTGRSVGRVSTLRMFFRYASTACSAHANG